MPSTLSPLEPGFMLLQGNRLEDLRDLLSEWITSYPLKPLEDECILEITIAVMMRWGTVCQPKHEPANFEITYKSECLGVRYAKANYHC